MHVFVSGSRTVRPVFVLLQYAAWAAVHWVEGSGVVVEMFVAVGATAVVVSFVEGASVVVYTTSVALFSKGFGIVGTKVSVDGVGVGDEFGGSDSGEEELLKGSAVVGLLLSF